MLNVNLHLAAMAAYTMARFQNYLGFPNRSSACEAVSQATGVPANTVSDMVDDFSKLFPWDKPWDVAFPFKRNAFEKGNELSKAQLQDFLQVSGIIRP